MAKRRTPEQIQRLLKEADRLLNHPPSPSGELGIQVQDLTTPIAKATGASSGVVVTYVDAKGPSAATLAVGDVVEAINGTPLETPLHWKARALKLTAGEAVNLRVRRNGEVRELKLAAGPSHVLQKEFTVGLTLRQYEPSQAFGRQNPTSGTPKPHRVHRVQSGETLDRIAARYYGDSTRWRALAAANSIADPLALRPGTLLTVPRIDS